ncbi:MAG: ABC transporter permease [Nitrobacter sp.]|uniref:FtsX-like permease family protein n=1 Tax=Nitrobacter sp. TaxID=29420 RepID=UPI00263793DC|nr:ABC transporter permease [Nitrobacter sp.]MCV0386014.1 ABC transporter permease [Nitrobacter sp.]
MKQGCWILAVLLSHWRRHPLQLTTLMAGLISATALWSGVEALNQQARASYDRAAAVFGGSRTAMLVGQRSSTFSQQLFIDLRRAGWQVSPVIEGRVRIQGRPFRLLGIEPVTFPAQAGTVPAIGKSDLKSFIAPPGEALVAPETLAALGGTEGAVFRADDSGALPPFKVQAELAPGVVIVDIGQAQRLLHLPGRISRLLVDNIRNRPPPLEAVTGDMLKYVAADSETDLERLTDSFHLNLSAFGLLSFLVGLFIVYSAVGLAFEQRMPMFRTLRACGVSSRTLNSVVLIELLVLAIAGGLIGLVCGYLIAAALLPNVAASLHGLYGARVSGALVLGPEWWIASLAMSAVGTLAASATSLLKVIRLSVLAAAKPYTWQQSQRRWLGWQGLMAVAMLVAAITVLMVGGSLISGFAVLALLLLGAALALPVLLEAVLRIGERNSRQPLVMWFWADSRQQLPGLSLALMALLLALAVNVGVGTMVESFSKTFAAWLDGRLAADVYVNALSDAQARDIEASLRARPEVTAILPSGRAEIEIGGWPAEVLGLADHATYRDRWPLLESQPNAWDNVKAGEGVLVSEQLARRLKLRPGGRLDVSTPTGIWSLHIAAIYADYGNPKGQIAVDIDAFRGRFPNLPRTRFGLRVSPGKIAPLIDDMRREFRLDESRLSDQSTLKLESTRIFNRTFAVTAALNTFTLGVAGVALLTSLLTLSHSRLPQLAPLWALGVTRRQLAGIELLRTISIAFITAMLALPLGLLVAWCLIAVVNVRAFGWRLPFHVFPLHLAELLGVAMLASLLAVLIPVVRLMRMAPAALIRIFANER